MIPAHGEEDYGKEFSIAKGIVYGVRPWGHYINLYDGPDCKIKRIVVKPGQRLSYQYHFKREEYWQIISGNGVITINDTDIELAPGNHARITCEVRHRIRNDGDEDLVFIEIQTGTYFGEDDIVRIDDDYGRAKTGTLEYDPTDPYDEGK